MIIRPEFFDIFGVLTFTILLIIGLKIRVNQKKASTILIIIGILGLIVDGTIVIKTYLIGG